MMKVIVGGHAYEEAGLYRSSFSNAMQSINRKVAMNLLKKWLSLISLTLVAATAFAGGSQTNVTVTGVQAGQAVAGYGTGPFALQFPSDSVGSPTCATARNFFAIDPTTAQGRAAIAVALMAYAQGKTVSAAGAGTCTIYGGIEDLAYIYTTS
jgi:hypothetical protein